MPSGDFSSSSGKRPKMTEKHASIAVETMSDTELWTLLRDSLQGVEASAWQKAALELNRRLVVAQVGATNSLTEATKTTVRATYVLAAASIAVALFSIIQVVICTLR
jgi:hypothetical protein